MERLWAPWRMAYIGSAREEDEPDCLFCGLAEKGDDEAALILARSERAFVVLNAFPYSAGHLMVAPFRHTGKVEELEDEDLLETGRLLQRAVAALREVANPDGFNLGMNLGQVAGAGVPDHLHWHVVPRWSGDTNFMPVVADAKVIPEALEETYTKLRPRLSP